MLFMCSWHGTQCLGAARLRTRSLTHGIFIWDDRRQRARASSAGNATGRRGACGQRGVGPQHSMSFSVAKKKQQALGVDLVPNAPLADSLGDPAGCRCGCDRRQHRVRRLGRTPPPSWNCAQCTAELIPCAAVGGALFVLACDVLARSLPTHGEIPLGVVSGLIGAPLFLYLMVRTRREAQLS